MFRIHARNVPLVNVRKQSSCVECSSWLFIHRNSYDHCAVTSKSQGICIGSYLLLKLQLGAVSYRGVRLHFGRGEQQGQAVLLH